MLVGTCIWTHSLDFSLYVLRFHPYENSKNMTYLHFMSNNY
jgi:hypothetical protein